MMINIIPTIIWILGFILGCFIGFVIYTFYCGRKYINFIMDNTELIEDEDDISNKIEVIKKLINEIDNL